MLHPAEVYKRAAVLIASKRSHGVGSAIRTVLSEHFEGGSRIACDVCYQTLMQVVRNGCHPETIHQFTDDDDNVRVMMLAFLAYWMRVDVLP